MVEQLYTNARTDTYKHPSRYVRAAVGIGRGARSGWVELGWRMGRIGATRPQIGGGVRAISSGNREGCAQQMGRIGVADGSAQDNEWGRLGRRMGRSGTTRPHFGGGSTFIRRDRYVWMGRSEAYSVGKLRMVGGSRWKASRLRRDVRCESV